MSIYETGIYEDAIYATGEVVPPEPDTGVTQTMPFPLIAGRVQLTTAAVSGSDVYLAGLRSTGAAIRAVVASAAVFANGKPLSASGQLCIVDATASLPANAVYSGGLPYSSGALCVSENAVANVQNGIPFDVNGAVASEVIA